MPVVSELVPLFIITIITFTDLSPSTSNEIQCAAKYSMDKEFE